jgi:hypothetical protein
MISYSLPKPSRLHCEGNTGRVGTSRGYSRPRIMLPVVEFRRSKICGWWYPVDAEGVRVLLEHNIELRPSIAPGDVIKDCSGRVWAKFINSEVLH